MIKGVKMSRITLDKVKVMKVRENMIDEFWNLVREVVSCEYWKGDSVEVLRDEFVRMNKTIISIGKDIEEIAKTYSILDSAIEVAAKDKQKKMDELGRNTKGYNGRIM